MNSTDINQGLKFYLEDNSAGLPSDVDWPNQDFTPTAEYLKVTFSGGSWNDNSLKGGDTNLRTAGVMMVLVVVEQNKSEEAAQGYADTIRGLFLSGTTIPVTGGQITILKADIRAGFEGDADWRVPVIMNYVATKKSS